MSMTAACAFRPPAEYGRCSRVVLVAYLDDALARGEHVRFDIVSECCDILNDELIGRYAAHLDWRLLSKHRKVSLQLVLTYREFIHVRGAVRYGYYEAADNARLMGWTDGRDGC